MASSAWILGVDMYAIHLYAQFGSGALAASIHVSAQPVAPSFGMVSFTGACAAFRVDVWYGHAAPTTTSPFWKSEISWLARSQYFLISGCSAFNRLTAAVNCVSVSSYGSVIPRLGFDDSRYSAASAI